MFLTAVIYFCVIQMADPLTALIHAVQVMNLLKTLILKNLHNREESAAKARLLSVFSESPGDKSESCQPNLNSKPCKTSLDACAPEVPSTGEFLRSATMNSIESNAKEKSQKKNDGEEELNSISGSNAHSCEMGTLENGCKGEYDNGDWLSLRKGVRRLCRHPVFQLSKPAKKSRELGIVNNRGGGGEAWA